MLQLIALALLTWPDCAGSADGVDPVDKSAQRSAGTFVQALWLVQAVGTWSDAKAKDLAIKTQLFQALKDGAIQSAEAELLIPQSRFAKIAGIDKQLSSDEIKQAVQTMIPASRKQLAPETLKHLDLLTTSFDMIDPSHQATIESLAGWIAKNYQPGHGLHVVIVCTGNSRRSMMGACMGNLAAAYYGFDDLHFHSGGTEPSAFNSRTVATLKAIGVDIESTGKEAPRGQPQTANPIYLVKWGAGLQAEEFSKHYADPVNPQSNFAAIMVCSEADSECPTVQGASLRLSLPFLDPKIYDGSSLESAKYDERRDDIGRHVLSALSKARNLLNQR